MPAYLADRGLRAADGVAALAIIALANIAGTYVCGILGARYRRKHLLAYIYLIRAGAMALFFLLPLSVWSVYAFSAVMGFIWLGTVPLTNGLISQVFGVRYITTLFGFVFFGHQLGSFLGVWLGGLVYEATHSYDLIWLGAIALGLLAAMLHWPIDDRELPRRAWRRQAPEGRPRRRAGTAPGRYSGRCCVPAPIVMCSMRQGRPPWPCARRPWARQAWSARRITDWMPVGHSSCNSVSPAITRSSSSASGCISHCFQSEANSYSDTSQPRP